MKKTGGIVQQRFSRWQSFNSNAADLKAAHGERNCREKMQTFYSTMTLETSVFALIPIFKYKAPKEWS